MSRLIRNSLVARTLRVCAIHLRICLNLSYMYKNQNINFVSSDQTQEEQKLEYRYMYTSYFRLEKFAVKLPINILNM